METTIGFFGLGNEAVTLAMVVRKFIAARAIGAHARTLNPNPRSMTLRAKAPILAIL